MSYENLVLEGGGVKVIGFCGALEVLENTGNYSNIKRLIGSSGGAIVGGLLAVGYTIEDVTEIMTSLNLSDFVDEPWTFVGKMYCLVKNYGIYNQERFVEWYAKKLKCKTGIDDTKFTDLIFERDNDPHLDLTITGVSLGKKDVVFFNKTNTPNMSIAKAVGISIALPGVFHAEETEDDMFVDGGLMLNYPIDYYDTGIEINEKTIGLKLVTKKEYSFNEFKVGNVVEYLFGIIDAMQMKIEKMHIGSGYWERTIAIDTGDISTTQFDLNAEQKEFLIKNGYTSAYSFFNKRK